MPNKYYLSVNLGDEKIEREVTLEHFIQAERESGFYPTTVKPSDPRYATTLATGGFGYGAMSGRIEYVPDRRPLTDDDIL